MQTLTADTDYEADLLRGKAETDADRYCQAVEYACDLVHAAFKATNER